MEKKFTNKAEQLRYEHIQELKKDNDKTFTMNYDNKTLHMKILNRGEQFFYQDGDRAFICEISVFADIIYTESIKRWDNGEKINNNEMEEVKRNIERFFMDIYTTTISFT